MRKFHSIAGDKDNVIAHNVGWYHVCFPGNKPIGEASALVAEERWETSEGSPSVMLSFYVAGEGRRIRRLRSIYSNVRMFLWKPKCSEHVLAENLTHIETTLCSMQLLNAAGVTEELCASPEDHGSPLLGTVRAWKPGLDLIGRRVERPSICHHLGDNFSDWHAPSLTSPSALNW